MDVNAEIATRATAVLVLMQDWLISRPVLYPQATAWETRLAGAALAAAPAPTAGPPAAMPAPLLKRAAELLATKAPTRPITDSQLWPDFLVLARGLVNQLAAVPQQEDDLRRLPMPPGNDQLAYLDHVLGELPRLLATATQPLPPAAWRRALRRLLYRAPRQRLALCLALSHQPKTDFFEPLLVQTLLADVDARRVVADATGINSADNRLRAVYYLLDHPEVLADCLDTAELAVPFAHVLGRELEEIARRRAWLNRRPDDPDPAPCPPDDGPAPSLLPDDPLAHAFGPSKGPFGIAEEAELLGLGLSGGGIRSATFALGAVQALAQHGWLPRLDYLSTVSGGGYLGSWLVALIQRLGSVRAAQQYLDPTLAANPRAEENRPVRWLRSFSNYLTPRASLFSTDTWTLGTTWLRNALLNQAILVLFLSAVLLLPHLLLARWQWWGGEPQRAYALLPGLLLLALAAGLAGWQQHWYDRRAGEAPPALPPWLAWLPVPGILPPLLLAAGWYLAAYAAHDRHGPDGDYWRWFGWAGGVLGSWLLLVAALGRYHLCFRWKQRRDGWAWVVLFFTSVLAAAAAAALLMLVARQLPPLVANAPRTIRAHLAAVMVLGPAVLTETLGLALTIRMALLGPAFTDERREWWGRLGAQTHLAVLGWVLLMGAGLLLPYLLELTHSAAGTFWPTTTAAWVALVGAGVKLAQSSAAPAKASAGPQSKKATAIDLITRVTPYLFLVGLLVLLVVAWHRLLPVVGHWGKYTLAWPTTESSEGDFYPDWQLLLALIAALLGLSWLLAWRVGVNEFSLHHFYKNRLLRAYLGASRPRDERQANPYTDFDTADDLLLCHLRACPLVNADESRPQPYHGPLPLFNTALNVTRGGELAHQDRQAEAFVFSPLYAGFDFARLVPVQHPDGRYAEYAYRPTHAYAYPASGPPRVASPTAGGVHVGTAMAISGAAANPNMGYHSSPVTALLLTLFNVRLGWWMGNPRRATWQSANPKSGLGYLLKDLFGRAAPTDAYVCLSDGGHFDNLGLYELVRRRCRYIIICDGEEDADRRFEGLANAIRRCRVDFGAEITLDLSALSTRDALGHTTAHAALGTIAYPDQPTPGVATGGPPTPPGHLLYLKATLTGHEPPDVLEYAHQNPVFPHQSTGDQFFSEDQFESYRQLGYYAGNHLFAPWPGPIPPHADPLPNPAPLFEPARFQHRYPISPGG